MADTPGILSKQNLVLYTAVILAGGGGGVLGNVTGSAEAAPEGGAASQAEVTEIERRVDDIEGKYLVIENELEHVNDKLDTILEKLD